MQNNKGFSAVRVSPAQQMYSYLEVTVFQQLLDLANFSSEDLAATNFSDFDTFLKNFNNFRYFFNAFF